VNDLVQRSIKLDGELCVICVTVCLNTRNSLLEIGEIWKLMMRMLQGKDAGDATHDGLKNEA